MNFIEQLDGDDRVYRRGLDLRADSENARPDSSSEFRKKGNFCQIGEENQGHTRPVLAGKLV
jgi:hypothetical protein